MPKSALESTKGSLKVALQIDQGAAESFDLDGNLTIHDFKRFVLTLTDNKPFYL